MTTKTKAKAPAAAPVPHPHDLPASQWPRLSETLTGPRHPQRCQSCGVAATPGAGTDEGAATSENLTVWTEHDERDRPERIYVVLCKTCGDTLIEPHPRLYRNEQSTAAIPGVMQICAGCAWRDGTRCAHPDARANNGAGVGAAPTGMRILYPDRDFAHLNFGGGRGMWMRLSAPSDCNGREEEYCVTEDEGPAIFASIGKPEFAT